MICQFSCICWVALPTSISKFGWTRQRLSDWNIWLTSQNSIKYDWSIIVHSARVITLDFGGVRARKNKAVAMTLPDFSDLSNSLYWTWPGSKTDDLPLFTSALFRAQPLSSLYRSAVRLWLYLGVVCLEFFVRLLLQFLGKVGSCCCSLGDESPYNRLLDTNGGVPRPSGGRYPFVFTDKLKVGRDSEGRKLLNSYLVLQTLDTGSSGKVKLAIDINSRDYYVR